MRFWSVIVMFLHSSAVLPRRRPACFFRDRDDLRARSAATPAWCCARCNRALAAGRTFAAVARHSLHGRCGSARQEVQEIYVGASSARTPAGIHAEKIAANDCVRFCVRASTNSTLVRRARRRANSPMVEISAEEVTANDCVRFCGRTRARSVPTFPLFPQVRNSRVL